MTEKLTPEQTATLLWELSRPIESTKREMAVMFHPTQEETKGFLAQLDRMNAGEGHALQVEVADVKRIARSWLSLHAENERLREALAALVSSAEASLGPLMEYAMEVRCDWSFFDGRSNLHRIEELTYPLDQGLVAARAALAREER